MTSRAATSARLTASLSPTGACAGGLAGDVAAAAAAAAAAAPFHPHNAPARPPARSAPLRPLPPQPRRPLHGHGDHQHAAPLPRAGHRGERERHRPGGRRRRGRRRQAHHPRLWHLPGQPAHGHCRRRQDVQDEVRQPVDERARRRPAHHALLPVAAEPRLRRGPRHAARRLEALLHQRQRLLQRGHHPRVPALLLRAVPPCVPRQRRRVGVPCRARCRATRRRVRASPPSSLLPAARAQPRPTAARSTPTSSSTCSCRWCAAGRSRSRPSTRAT